MLRIALFHPWIYLKGGAEKVLLEYSKHTKHALDIKCGYLGNNTFEELKPISKALNNRIFNVSVKRTFSHSLASLLAILTSQNKSSSDVLLISSEGFGDFFALLRRAKAKHTIAFVHTPLKLVYDKDSLATTRVRIGALRYYFFFFVIRPIYKIVNRVLWRRYESIIANSKETKKRIIEGRLAKAENIKIAYPGTNIPKFETLISSAKKYSNNTYLIPGRIMIQKNIEMGIKAFNRASLKGAKLIITGHCDDKSRTYFQYLSGKYKSDTIDFIPTPTDTQYESLMASAKCVIFPPVNEDWGIIPIEAMAYGTPVICSNKGGPAESVVHKKTGLLHPPVVDDFVSALNSIDDLSESDYKRMSDLAKQRANEFTWEKFARELDDIIEDIASK